MSPDDMAREVFSKYGLGETPRISDPGQALYRAFGLVRGSLFQVAGPKVMLRGLGAVLRHGLARPRGDVAQMPGTFLLHKGQILREFRHQTSADRPDYLALIGGDDAASA